MVAMTDRNDNNSIGNAEKIIARFGGIRPMAHKMSVPVTTVQGWKKRNAIPVGRLEQVIKAAETNNIDLSDLVDGAANENTFSTTEAAAPREAVVTATRRAAPSTEAKTPNEEMLEQMKAAQSLTFTKSVWFTSVVVTIVVLLSAALLWPSKQKIAQNGMSIATLQGGFDRVKEGQSFLRKLIPDDIEQRFDKMQQQTKAIQETVTVLSTQAGTIANDVLDPTAPVSTRIQRLEEHVVGLVGPSQLTGMLQKIQELSQSMEGQMQLSNSITDLNGLLQGLQGGGNVDEALQQAQQEDDALGQTLQGVAPQDLKAASLLLGMAQFRSSLNRSAPFEEDLTLMQNLLGEDDPELQAAIARLAPKAAEGVLTPEGLKGEFKGLAGEIVVASLKGEDVSVRERAKARLNNIMQVEKDGELITGTDTQAKILRAQNMLDEGDIEGAIAELQGLEGEAAVVAQPFIDDAQITMMAEQLQGMFAGRVLNRVGGDGLGLTAKGAGLMQEIKKMAPPQRRVIRNEASGMVILEPKMKYAPDMSTEP